MKVAILLGFTALLAVQAAAVPAAEPEAGINQILGKPVPKLHKHHHHKHHKHHHHKHRHHKGHLGQKSPNGSGKPKKAHPLGIGFCGSPGSPCLGGRDVETLQGYEEGYCGTPGNPCNTVKRSAWAIADALEAARDVTDSPSFDGAPGTPGALAEEAIDAIAAKARDMYGGVYEREAEAFAEAEANLKRDAAPDAKHLGIGFCGPPGSPCLGGRDAAPEPRKHLGIGFCGPPGSPCLGGRDVPDPEAEAWENNELGFCSGLDTPCLALRDAKPTKHAHPLGVGFCGPPGSPCLGGKREAAPQPLHAREAAPEAKHLGIGFCGPPGSPCLGGRDAEPRKHLGIGFCGPPGSPCLGGRDAEPKHLGIGFCGPPGSPCLGGRDAAPEPKKAHPLGIGFCGPPGSPCLGGRDAAAEPKHLGIGFCGPPGSPCLGGRDLGDDTYCGIPGSPCVRGEDAKALAKAVNKTDPTWLRQECHKPGHACHTLFNIHDAFHKAKGEAKELGKTKDGLKKWEAHCGDEGAEKCGFLTYAHQYTAKHNKPAADKVEQYCNNRGLCTEAKRDLDELERGIDAAVSAIQAAA